VKTVFRILPVACLAFLIGCRESKAPTGVEKAAAPTSDSVSGQFHGELLSYAIDNLNRLEEFDSAEVLEEIVRRLNMSDKTSESEHRDPLLAAWPEPEMLRQIVDRLNQWVRTQQSPADWKLDPMAASLAKRWADLPCLRDLGQMEFSRFDGYALQEAVWLRDVSRWTRGEALDDLDRAKSLFDWTIRNVQLEKDQPERVPQFPWEALLFGHGTATERAWIFMLLARQVGIDAAMLGFDEKAADGKSSIRPWCVGVLIEGNVYLFDPLLGLPIPAPDGVSRDESGRLVIRPATLAQLVADEKLLRRLDADDTHKYPVKASDLKHVVVMLEASPTYLAKRMKFLESRLVGPQKMVLSALPSELASQWKKAHLADVQLWAWPYETLERRSHLARREQQMMLAAMLPFYAMPSAPLRRGRALHLKGKLIGDEGAISYYQLARPSNQELSASSAHPMEKLVYLRGKQDASYWSGLIAYHRANYSTAIDYFVNRTLLATPNNPWTEGARYNLGRSFEAAGDAERAILQYEGDVDSPGYLGELLRAKWLKEQVEKRKAQEKKR
jgi:hypothetical protein